MNKRLLYISIILIRLAGTAFLYAQHLDSFRVLEQKLSSKHSIKNDPQQHRYITFNYDNEPLADIIHFIASEKKVNIILPSEKEALSAKVYLSIPHLLSLDEAWDILATLLAIAGYTITLKGDLYVVVKNSKEIAREPLPIYINTPLEQLPNNDLRIRYMIYLSNIQVTNEPNSTVVLLLKELLSENAKYQIDEGTNALIISDKANVIQSVMRIILALDQTSFQEKLEIIRLRYVDVSTVEQLFNEQILPADQRTKRYQLRREKENVHYFAENVKIIGEPRTNSLLILGKMEAVERIKDFIFKYLDVELESGKSILHVYQLQYLRAEEFAPILDNIVKSAQASSQAAAAKQARAGKPSGGVRRLFDEVIIRADKPQGNDEGKYAGGNKLIIAARKNDWIQIKKLIEQLDIPQPQVIIEVLIADLTVDDTRALGSITRNADLIPLQGSMNFQSAQAGPVILDSATNPTTVKSDLLGNVLKDSSGNPISVASTFPAGTTLVELNDSNGQTWGLAAIADLINDRKVLSHTHVSATNNKEALISVGQSRIVDDQASGSTGGTTTATRKRIDANLSVKITPRISSANSVNLEVQIEIVEFKSNNLSSGDRIDRSVRTNAHVGNQAVLALGGLTRVDTTKGVNKWPILGDIPIIGWFFKNRQGVSNKTNLTVFISPTIVEPRLRGGVGQYTKDYISIATKYANEGMLFDNLRDPITRWFFAPGNSRSSESIEQFYHQNILYQDAQERSDASPADAIHAAIHGQPVAHHRIALPTEDSLFLCSKENEEENLKKLLQDTPNPLIVGNESLTTQEVIT